MKNEFNIKKMIINNGGYVGLPFPNLNFENLQPDLLTVGEAIKGKNILGKPFFMDVTIDGVRLPNEPLITISSKKNIVETALIGNERKGTVKEFISNDNYKIKIEGVCIDMKNPKSYPTEQVQNIIDLVSKNIPVSISNSICELFQINEIVIKNYSFPNMQGKPFSQGYILMCESNEDFYAIKKSLQ
ncbi:DUF6046 domain-containing protein [Tamlana sp. 62-3]|uniref:DUF6046 domain-containing protein n=1 Tax=Neotamlana sargassicola TaxID=2883125 RepID=A0A9X1I4F2_9FLAO|nr:DUF6046 domain-containing protein [Tamlana sargassicola]MCB4807132.1 DUF6046 domain-containing protein [Tamlana sargassicola]